MPSRRSGDRGRPRARAGSARPADGQAEAAAGRRPSRPTEPPIPIFGCPAHDAEDRLALEMLQQVLDPARWDLEVIAPATLTAELLDQVAERRPAAGLHRGDPARRPGPHPLPVQAAAVPVPRPEDPRGPLGAAGHHDDRAGPRGRRRSRGRDAQGGAADSVASAQGDQRRPDDRDASRRPAPTWWPTTLLETRQQLASLLPVLVQGRSDGRGSGGAGAPARRAPDRERAAVAPEPGGGGRGLDLVSWPIRPAVAAAAGRDRAGSSPRDTVPLIDRCTPNSPSSRRA